MAGQCEPNNQKYDYLHQLTLDKLLELLSVAPIPASSPEEEAYADALEEVILEKERENPTGFLPDVGQQWSEFQEYYRAAEEENSWPDMETGLENTPSAYSRNFTPNVSKPSVKLRRVWRSALVAATTVVLILGCMVVAQAAGVDVFGAMARWTESTFSFGTVRSDGATDEMYDDLTENQLVVDETNASSEVSGYYSSLQEALDAYGVTEVTAPTWIPEDYIFDQVNTLYTDDSEQLIIVSTYYKDESNLLDIFIASYIDEPNAQIEKTDTIPETFEFEGITFYLIENTANYTVAWATDHFECYIEGAKDMEPEILRNIVYSMF